MIFQLPLSAFATWVAVAAALVYLVRESDLTREWRDRMRERRDWWGWIWRGLEACAPCCSAWSAPLSALLVAPGLLLPGWLAVAWWACILAPLTMVGFFYVVTQLSLMQGWAAITRSTAAQRQQQQQQRGEDAAQGNSSSGQQQASG